MTGIREKRRRLVNCSVLLLSVLRPLLLDESPEQTTRDREARDQFYQTVTTEGKQCETAWGSIRLPSTLKPQLSSRLS